MLAVLVNVATVLLGSTIGILCRKHIRESLIRVLISALALVTLIIGITSAVQTQDILCLIVCTLLGTAAGVLLRLDERISGAGEFVRAKLFHGRDAGRFTEGFVTACLVFCVGSMTIMGSFEAGINRNYTIIFAKSALDFVSSMMFGAAMGIGVTCSALFVLVFQGALTLLAGLLSPYLSAAVVTEMSAVGGALLIGMGINMLELSEKRIQVASMLPAIFLPIAYLPLSDWLQSLL